jgi:hypothetical protein
MHKALKRALTNWGQLKSCHLSLVAKSLLCSYKRIVIRLAYCSFTASVTPRRRAFAWNVELLLVFFSRILRNPQHSGVIVTTYAGTDRSSLYRIKISCSRCYNISHNCASLSLYCCLCRTIRPKKIPVVPVSYREKIRVGRSEIKFFFKYIFHGFGGFFLLGDLQ